MDVRRSFPKATSEPCTFAQLTRSIAEVKRQRTWLRAKRAKVSRTRAFESHRTLSEHGETMLERCPTRFEGDGKLPRRLVFSQYCVDVEAQREDILCWWRQSKNCRMTAGDACTKRFKFALPETLCWFHPAGGLDKPITHIQLGEWELERSLNELLAASKNCLVDIDFAPCVRARTEVTPWYSCRCSSHDCSSSEDCRLASCASLFGSAVSDAQLSTIATKLGSQLRKLSLAYCTRVTEHGVENVLRALGSSLTYLNLSREAGRFSNSADDDSLARMLAAQDMRQLESLMLNGWSEMTDIGLAAIVRASSRLNVLELFECRRLTDVGVQSALDECLEMSELRLGGCTRIIGNCFADVAGGAVAADDVNEDQVALVRVRSELKKLDLGGCLSLRPSTLRWIATCSYSLTELCMAGSAVNDDGLRALAMAPDLRLKSFDVSGCSGLCADGGSAFVLLVERQGINFEHIDVRRVTRLTPHIVSALFACFRLLSLRLDHVPSVNGDALGGGGQAVAALEDGEALLAASLFPRSSETVDLLPRSEERSHETTRGSLLRNRNACRRQLQALTLSGCHKVSPSVVAWLAQRLPHLIVLDLNKAGAGGAVTDASMCAIAEYCQSLCELSAARLAPARGLTRHAVSAAYVTDVALYEMGRKLRRLQRLDLSYQTYLVGDGLAKLPRAWPFLEVLKIAGWDNVNPCGLRSILAAAPNVTFLDASACLMLKFHHIQEAAEKRYYVVAERSLHGGILKPTRGAAAYARRDAIYARFRLEDLASTVIACAHRWSRTRRMFRRRFAARRITRAIKGYRQRRLDAFRQNFVQLVKFRRLQARSSALRLQRICRRRIATRKDKAAVRIQFLYRKKYGRWISAMLNLYEGSATLAQAAWRGRRTRINFSIAFMMISKQYRKEICSDAANVIHTSVRDIQHRRAVKNMGQHMAELKRDINTHRVASAMPDAHHALSLPTSRKRTIGVYQVSLRMYKIDGVAVSQGRAHVYTTTLWPQPPKKLQNESAGDFDANQESYAYRASHFEQGASNAGVRISRIPWRSTEDFNSLFVSLEAARRAQAKRAILLDKAAAVAEQIKVEETKRLELALKLEAEETERQERLNAKVSSIRLNSASRLCALSRGRAARLEVKRLRIQDEIRFISRKEAICDHAARVIQRRVRGMSVRHFMTTCNFELRLGYVGTREIDKNGSGQHGLAFVVSADDPVERKEQMKALISKRVDLDFLTRRFYERQLAIQDRRKLMAKCDKAFEGRLASCYARLVPLDVARERFVDLSNANHALTQALQSELKSLGGLGRDISRVDMNDEAAKQALRRAREIDIALKRSSARRAHLNYVSEILDTCKWWGVETLRHHYRRHRSCAVLTVESSARLEWIEKEAEIVWKLLEFVQSRLQEIPKESEVANRYFLSWLQDQAARLISQRSALDAEQEHVLRRDLNQLSKVLEIGEGSGRFVDELIHSLLLDGRYDAEKIGLDLSRIGESPESESAINCLRSASALKRKQEDLHKTVHLQLRAKIEELHASEAAKIDQRVVFEGDQQGLRRDKLSSITAALRNNVPEVKLFDQDRWFDVYRSQPWLAIQEVDENKRRELRDVKRIEEANMAGIVDQKRHELAEMADVIQALENRLAETHSTLADPTASRDAKSRAQSNEITSRDRLPRLREDYDRRRGNLTHLEQQLSDFQNQLANEDRESSERLAAAKAAKADFERREENEERKRVSIGEERLREIDAEIQVIADLGDHFSSSERTLHELEIEKLAVKLELSKLEDRVRRREALEAVAKAEAEAEEAVTLKKELQAKLRQEKKEEAAIRAKKKIAERENLLTIKAAKKREKAEEEARLRANDVLYHMGLEDPTLHRARPVKTKLREAVRKQIVGHETAATAAHESSSMHSSLLRRQKLKIGAVSALRAIQFTVGAEETNEFADTQSSLAARSQPHFVRLKKTIGLKSQIVLWLEYSLDQDQFITDIELAATNEKHPLYKNHSREWQRWTHANLAHSTPEEPGLVIWTRRRAKSTLAISGLEIAYTTKDGEVLAEEGYARVSVLSSFGDSLFGDLSVWVKRVNRNARPKFENEETVLQELKQTHKLLKARPNDNAAKVREKGILRRLEKVREDAEFRDKYKNDPLKYAIEFLALTQSELEKWMRYFESIDIDRMGYVTPEQILRFLGLRTDCNFLRQIFATLGGIGETRLDFGETLKCIGSFCFFQEREIVHFAYKLCDADDAGLITHDELLRFLSDLHTESQRGQTTRALKEINLVDGAQMSFDDFLEIHQKFPNILHPAFAFQHKIRRRFFGVAFWERKLRKYMETKAAIRESRSLNTENASQSPSSGTLFFPALTMGRKKYASPSGAQR